MKILAIFLDMLTGEYLNTCNPLSESRSYDDFISSLGGKIYTNSYTVAPDTPRSSACMWTGLYPKRNGCYTRATWPRENIKDIENLWNVLDELNYNVNIYIHSSSKELGQVPFYGKENIYSESIYEFFDKAKITDNSFNFFSFPDIHYILGETGYMDINVAVDFATELVKEVLEYYGGADTFDYIVMFSDHGFQMGNESYMLSKTRTHTFFFERFKGDKELTYDYKLRSNMDLFPTICELINYKIKSDVDGKCLWDKSGHKYVLQEDLEGFATEISQRPEHWAVITEDGKLHRLEADGKWIHEENSENFDETFYLEKIKSTSSGYELAAKFYPTVSAYKKSLDEFNEVETYSTGERFCKRVYEFLKTNQILDKSVVIYGAGTVGQGYYRQLKDIERINVVGWIDMNYKVLRNSLNPCISGIDTALKEKYDYIIIAIKDEKASAPIRQMLIDIGVSENKILWEAPVLKRYKA